MKGLNRRSTMEFTSTVTSSSVQLSGVFLKKPEDCSKWTRRFMVIKDGFLLIYPESEKKEFERKKVLNLNPKSIIPLGNNEIECCSDSKYPFCVLIRGAELIGSLRVAMDSEYEREKWIVALSQASRLTWKNLQLNDSLIQHLEKEGLRMAEEKQNYYDKFQNEVIALHDEKLKSEELENIKDALETEKLKMEQLTLDLKEEYEKLKDELKDTAIIMNEVLEEKSSLESTNSSLTNALESLEMDKLKIQDELMTTSSHTDFLSKENECLNSRSQKLQKKLKKIEDETMKLLTEKRVIEDRLNDKEITVTLLQEEKDAITEHAQSLQISIKDISKEKDTAQSNLKEEITARLEAERKLKEAEHALDRLEIAVNNNNNNSKPRNEEEQNEMNKDVHTLRSFFENLAFDEKIEAEKTLMIKNSLHSSKKLMRRAQTLKYRPNRKNKYKSADDGIDKISAKPNYYCDYTLRHVPGSKFRHSSYDLSNNTLKPLHKGLIV